MYAFKDRKKGGRAPPACSPGLCAWPSRCCYPLTITENSVARSLANNIRFGLHVIARSKATKQSIAGSSSTPSNGRSIAAPVTPRLLFSHPRKKQRSGSACSAREQITAFGLYCPLSGQAFAVAFIRRSFCSSCGWNFSYYS